MWVERMVCVLMWYQNENVCLAHALHASMMTQIKTTLNTWFVPLCGNYDWNFLLLPNTLLGCLNQLRLWHPDKQQLISIDELIYIFSFISHFLLVLSDGILSSRIPRMVLRKFWNWDPWRDFVNILLPCPM